MHELLLFAPVPSTQHHGLLQQLCGLTAMQPIRTVERHLIFKAYRKPGFVKSRPGASQDVQSSEVQKLNKLLAGALYYVKVVGDVREEDFGAADSRSNGSEQQAWRVEFKDIPEAGARSGVTSRLVGSSNIAHGDLLASMNAWGFNYVSEHVVEGNKFVFDDTVLFLHRIVTFPASAAQDPTRPAEHLPSLNSMPPLDSSGGYVLEASITVQESGNPDLLRAASQRLLGLKEHLKTAVKLEPADRLALDTRVRA